MKSFRFAGHGVSHAFRVDKSFRLEIVLGLPVFAVIAFLLSPLLPWELLLLVGSYLLILMVELVNTAFEKMLDKMHPEEHEVIKHSKDIAAGAVLIAFVFASLVVLVLWYTRIHTGIPAMIERPFV